MNALAGLMNPAEVGQSLLRSFEHGQDRREKMDGRNALSAYAMNPNDPAAYKALALHDPKLAISARADQQKRHMDTLEANRDNIVRGAQLIRQMQPKDQAGWDQVRAAAQNSGIDISEVPPQFNEQYVQGLVSVADAFEPLKPEASPYQFIPYQPGGGVLRADKMAGTTTELVRPNDGSAPAGAPVNTAGGMPRVTDQASYDAIPPGATYQTPDGHTRVKQGGPTQPASGGFPVGANY